MESINTQESEPEGAPAQGFCVFFLAFFHEREEMDEASSIRGFFPMYHLTRNHKKLLRKNGSKVMLSLCVALALSGGLVWAEGKTYDYVNQWGIREALEGDPIEVMDMGSGNGYVQAGTDITNEVKVHSLGTYRNEDTKETPEACVKGRTIEIGTLGNSAGGNVSVGSNTTSSVVIGSLNNNSQSSTVVMGKKIGITSDYTGNWGGSLSIGSNITKSINIYKFGTSGESKSIVQGHDISTGTLGVWGADATFKADGSFRVAQEDNLQDIEVTGGGNLSITAGSMEAGKLSVSDNNSKADIHITGDEGLHLSKSIHTGEHVTIHIDSPLIRVDGDKTSWLYDSMNTTNSTISLGNDSSQIVMKGRLFNAGSNVTLKGKTIHIKAWPEVGSQNAIESTNGEVCTTIGNKNTENVYVDGKTVISGWHGNLSMAGRNISLSYPKGVALTGSAGNVHIGQGETENLVIHGQVADQSADTMQLSGQHITIDSTGYDGPENGGLYPESLLALNNNILAGTKDTQTISISSGLHAMGGGIQVLGKNITVGTSDYFRNKAQSGGGTLQTGYIAYATGNNVDIGSDDTDTVHLYGGQLLADGGDIDIQGKNISIVSKADYITPDKDGSVTMIHAKGGNVAIGRENSDTVDLSGGKLLADGGNIDIQGKKQHIAIRGHHISIDGKQQWAGQTNGGELTIGSQNSDSISIHGQGGIYALGGEVHILGKQISIQADSDKDNALMNNGGSITVGGNDVNRYALEGIGGNMEVGDSATESVNVDGGIHAKGSTISLKGKGISISRGKQGNAIYTDGGTVIVKAAGGNTAHISGPIRNEYGMIDISLTGSANHLDSQIITGTYDENGKFIGTYGAVMNLGLSDKASWNPSGNDSNFTTYTGDDGIIHLDNETHQTVTISEFNDKGTRIHEDIYGSKNTGNDTIYIDNSYTGNTHFWLVNRDDTDKGVVGTVLASALKKNAGSTSGAKARMVMAAIPVADPIAEFTANHFAAYGMSSLFFKTYGLGIKASDRQDYTKDLYITDVTNHTTNDKGQYTPTVSAAFSGSSLMYYTWRTENDKMLQRVGDLRENEGEETGLWTRIRGSRIGRDGYRGFKNQYKVYEIGYDAKTEDNDRMKSFTGIALSYLDGKGYYADGQGTNQATSAAIYHTDIHKTGHYLDLVFRIRHMNERFHTRDTVDTDIGPVTEDHSASLDTTGLSFSAEYGRKKFMGKGWYVEPRTQWTLGYLGPVQYEMDNGTRVEQPGITSFVGRAGFNLGRQVNENSIVYLKANVYHEFGGHSPLHLYAGDESLSFTDTFDDTWFEYGVGFAVKLGNGLSLYGDVEKTAGSHFYKDWQWNAGLRYSF